MEAYANILLYAIPGFVVLICVEWIVGYFKGIETNRIFDTVSSLSSGATNTLKEILGIAVIIVSYSWMVDHLALLHIEHSIMVYALAFLGMDFAGYWVHRWEHEVNIFWNRHIIHHSSEEFNLSCALRQNISAIVGIFFFLYLPMALLGVPAEVVAVVAPLHLFAQFWYHTKVIDKMWSPLEYVIVTPSHHRVHHAINPEYIDKNYGQILILWDRWFGTFQEELKDIPPVYGVKKAVHTWNPIWINFQHLYQLISDARHTHSLWDKIRIWWMPTGWRPEDVKERYPISILDSPYDQVKYDTHPDGFFKVYAVFQLVINLGWMLAMLSMFSDMSYLELASGSAFIFISIAAYTSIMDRSILGMPLILAQMCIGVILLYMSFAWTNLPFARYSFVVYLIISLLWSWMINRERTSYSIKSLSTT